MRKLAVALVLAVAACTAHPAPKPAPHPASCADADGPYYKDQDPEYDHYEDRDHDGVVCEK